MDQVIPAFFETYEEANRNSDLAAIADLYAETFLFARPDAVRSVRKEDFVTMIPRMKDHFASLGLTNTRLSSVDATHLDSRHTIAKVGWAMTVQTSAGISKTFDAYATYVLRRGDQGRLSIIFQLDHRDLAAIVNGQRNVT